MTAFYRGISIAGFCTSHGKPASMLFSSYTWFRSYAKLQLLFNLPRARLNCRGISTSILSKMYEIVEKGSLYTEDYRIYFKKGDQFISPLHDIPLFVDNTKKLYNMIVEIPRWTNAKMEINLKEPLNPIKQDVKKGKVRFVSNCFPHHGYIWNYGAFPQTWENPLHLDDSTGCKGDNDPIDVLEIGYKVAERGQVIGVKILGCVALIDEGETDWKIITINHEDPLAGQVNDLQDVEKFFPGLLKATIEWFKIYKIPDGKPENKFAFNGEAKNRDFATNVVDQVHNFWKALVLNDVSGDDISCANLTIENSPYKMSLSDANGVINRAPPQGPPASVDPSAIDKWHFVKLQRE